MRLLVIRSSAMGDVALTIPVIKAVRKKYPDLELFMLTQKKFSPLFLSITSLQFFSPDFKGRHKGFRGLFRLFLDLRKTVRPDLIIDLHSVIRSKMIGAFFRLTGKPVYSIDKGRSEKRSLITGKKKIFLKHTVERYRNVFERAGLPVETSKENSIIPPKEDLSAVDHLLGKDMLNIGVAPFAKHELKMWPPDYMTALLSMISKNNVCRFFLFGGREDLDKIEFFMEKVPGIVPLIEKLDLSQEIALMSRLDFMITMDSSNMHMAALCGTKVISIWGGTDPMAGFGAWMQPDSFSIRIPVEELDCRPCTIYGKGNTRNGFACMLRLTPEVVYERMKRLNIF